ncbi:MAG: GvpL/GvpF family gas vesicle protein [Candidatus Tectomicrobia bacterium]|nr:GvpL/GvpF family gas vesicle protein [Candidatus Tectomicrobia bacterium]
MAPLQTPDTPARGLYAYAVLEPHRQPPPGGPLGVIGIDGASPVEFVGHGAVLAAVSEVALEEFTGERLKANLQEMRWLSRRVSAHEAVVERLMAWGTLAPMKFGTLFSSLAALRRFLRASHEDLRDTLAALRLHEEWGVKVYGRSPAVRTLRRRLEDDQERLGTERSEAASLPAGRAYFQRKQTEWALLRESDATMEALARHIHALLGGQASRSAISPAPGGFPLAAAPAERGAQDRGAEEGGPRGGTRESWELLLNAAYLVPLGNRQRFLACAAWSNDQHQAPGLRLAITGPWPPYHFTPSCWKRGARV